MATTTYLGLRYPALSDSPNVPQSIQNATSDVDSKLGGVILCTSGTRPTSRAGAMIYETDTARMAKYTGSAWEYMASSRVAYTPTLTASTTNPTLGTGSSITSFYSIIPGPFVVWTFNVQFGTSGVNAGSGNYALSVPITMASVFPNVNTGLGSCLLFDSSSSTSHGGTVAYQTTTTVRMHDDASGLQVTNSQAWTWAASDTIAGTIIYPI